MTSDASARASDDAARASLDALRLGPELDDGNHEFKRSLLNVSPSRFDELVTQMKWRCMHEGEGEALYELGVDDDGTPRGLTEAELAESVATLRRMANEIDADCSTVCERRTKDGRLCATMLVRRRLSTAEHKEIRITTLGNVDSGKSTILGVLTRGGLDNGRGLARGGVFRHKHEIESGRTSSISAQIMGFASDGSVINYHNPDVREAHQLRWDQIVCAASKVIHFSDLCGHERYLRTTMHGIAGTLPDYALMCCDANRGGIVGMTKEHLSIMLGLKVPFFVLVTKIDMASPENLAATLDALSKMLKRPGVHKTPFIVRDEQDVMTSVKNIAGGVITPIFQVSCVTGQGLDFVRMFLNHIPARRMFRPMEGRTLVHLDDAFQVQGIGCVVSGLVVSGKVDTHGTLLIGPDGLGGFQPVQIKSVQNKRVAVESIAHGNTGSFAIKPKKGHIHKHDIRKGMILCDASVNPRATWQFQAEVLILAHPTTLKVGYSPILHCVTVRQAARIVSISGKDVLRMGDRALVTFEWSHRPEYLCEGSRIIFREGRTKGIGVIRATLPDVARTPPRNYKNLAPPTSFARASVTAGGA